MQTRTYLALLSTVTWHFVITHEMLTPEPSLDWMQWKYLTHSLHNTVLRIWLPLSRYKIGARSLVTSPHNTSEEAPPSTNPDEVNVHRQDRVHLSRLQCGYHLAFRLYENRLHPEINSACGDPFGMISNHYKRFGDGLSYFLGVSACGWRTGWTWDDQFLEYTRNGVEVTLRAMESYYWKE